MKDINGHTDNFQQFLNDCRPQGVILKRSPPDIFYHCTVATKIHHSPDLSFANEMVLCLIEVLVRKSYKTGSFLVANEC